MNNTMETKNELLYNEKGKGIPVIIAGLVVFALGVIIPVFLASMEALEAIGDENMEIVVTLVVTLLPMLLGVTILTGGVRLLKTNIQVYADHVEGVGYTKEGRNNQFYLSYGQIKSVSRESGVLIIHCDAVSYKLNLDSQKASEIYGYISRRVFG